MVWHLEEPVGGEDAAHLFGAAREAARHVTLVLTGCGLDGLFGGLPRHRVADLAFRYPWLRGPLGELYDQVHRGVPPASLAGRALGTAYHRGRDVTAARLRGAHSLEPFAGLSRGAEQPLTELLRGDLMRLPHQSSFERLLAGVGLRAAAPHMDPRLVEAALSVPDRLTAGRGIRKPILRKICEGMLPAKLISGRRGASAGDALRKSDALDRLAVELLSPGAVRDRGLVEPAYAAGLLRRARGRAYGPDRARRIWSLLLTELWARCFLDRAGAAPAHSLPVVRTLEGAPSGGAAAHGRPSVRNASGRPAE
jgi:asparagine synthase (glutamine-hydrolysing)